MIRTPDATHEMFREMDAGRTIETDLALHDEYLDMLPPRFMGRSVRIEDGRTVRAAYGFGEGEGRSYAAWREGDRYFMARVALPARA